MEHPCKGVFLPSDRSERSGPLRWFESLKPQQELSDRSYRSEGRVNEAREVWHITVRDDGDLAAPFDVRVRRWLKAGLRSYGIRVVSIADAMTTATPKNASNTSSEVAGVDRKSCRGDRPRRRGSKGYGVMNSDG